MPTVVVNRENLFKAIGKNFSDEEFDELCFEYGIELDEVTSERRMAANETGKNENELKELSDDALYKIEVGANRYDLLCLEGIAMALKVFLKISKPPVYKQLSLKESYNGKEYQKFYVDKSVINVRHFACSAILRNIKFTESSLKSFIDLQDKLHQNVCRQRSLATMGTHDLDSVKGPFYFKAEKPEDINFIALKRTKSTNGVELLNILKDDMKLKKYCHLLEGKEMYPVLYDSQGITMAMPPMINSEHSKITVDTKNVIIDVTAHDETKANIVLNMLITMFSVYSEQQFTYEPVEVIDSNGKSELYPKLQNSEFNVDLKYITKLAGVGDISNKQVCDLLEKMGIIAVSNSANENNKELAVVVPCTRTDVLHPCDIAEDLAISYGYNNIKKVQPTTICNGYQQPINKLTDVIRLEMSMAGYTECLTFALMSKDDAITKLGNDVKDSKHLDQFVQILKAKTQEFEVVRNSLIPGILKTIENNQKGSSSLPFKLFEISDVVFVDKKSDKVLINNKFETNETGAYNKRHLCFAYVNHHSGFEVLQGVLDHLLENKIGLKWNDENDGYTIKPSNNKMFFPDRQAEIIINNKVVGIYGVVHPEVNKKFGKILYPITICELYIEDVFNMILDKKLLNGKKQ